jgi:hypothetical protein
MGINYSSFPTLRRNSEEENFRVLPAGMEKLIAPFPESRSAALNR